ncbi:response regulator [Dictyobacter halimunensis]
MKEYDIQDTILVVEDDDSIGSLLIDALEMETPYNAELVTDGFQALKSVREQKPCLIITDYRLPHMDGLELCDRMHAMPEINTIPVILMSAYPPINEAQKRNVLCLQKPFELDDLLDTIEKLLG